MIKVLRQKRADLIAEGGKIIKAAQDENRALKLEENTRLDAIDGEIVELDAQIVRVEKQMDRMRGESGGRDHTASAARDERTFASLGEQMMAVARAGFTP